MKIKKLSYLCFLSLLPYIYPSINNDLVKLTNMESLIQTPRELNKEIRLYHPDKARDFILKSLNEKISRYINLFKGQNIKDIQNPYSDLNSNIKSNIEGAVQKAFLDMINTAYNAEKIEKFLKILAIYTGEHETTMDNIYNALTFYVYLTYNIKPDSSQLTEQQIAAFKAKDIDEIIKTTKENPYSLFISPKTREVYIDYMNNLITYFEQKDEENSAKRLKDIEEKLQNASWFKKDIKIPSTHKTSLANSYDYSFDAIKNRPLISEPYTKPTPNFLLASIYGKINSFISAQKNSDNSAKIKYAIGLMIFDFINAINLTDKNEKEIALQNFIQAVKSSPLFDSLSIPLAIIAETDLANITGKPLPAFHINMSSLTTLKDLKREIENVGFIFYFNPIIRDQFYQKLIALYTSNKTAENKAIFDEIYKLTQTSSLKPPPKIKTELDHLYQEKFSESLSSLNDLMQKFIEVLTAMHKLL